MNVYWVEFASEVKLDKEIQERLKTTTKNEHHNERSKYVKFLGLEQC